MSPTEQKQIDLGAVVGKGYGAFWNFRGRYRVVKGSRGSKKSATTALWLIYALMKWPESNGLVVRRFFNTLRQSCYAQLKWAIGRLGLEHEFRCTLNPLEITRVSTGQKIFFRGLEDNLKITSITIERGVLNFVWIEEAYEIETEEQFQRLDESLRGQMPDGYFRQFTIIFNPWSELHWLKRRFFDTPSPDTLALTTTYQCNEFLDDAYIKLLEGLRLTNPRRYRISALGEWGRAEGLIYERVSCEDFNAQALIKRGLKAWYGVDFGFTDPTAFIGGLIDEDTKTLYIFIEWYKTGVTNEEIARAIKSRGIKHEIVTCDSAEPKSIEELRRLGINAKPAAKGQDSVRHGIQKIQNYQIIVHPSCTEFHKEILNYAWATDRLGKPTDRPEHEFSHGPDAMRYGCDAYIQGSSFRWQDVF